MKNVSTSTYAIEAFDKLPLGSFNFGLQERIIKGIKDAVKFKLPLNAELITNPAEVQDSLLGAYKLPFPKVCIEFDVDCPNTPLGCMETSVAKSVCTYAEHLPSVKSFSESVGLHGAPDVEGFFAHSTVLTENGVWVPTFFAAIVPYYIKGFMREKGKSKIPFSCFNMGGKMGKIGYELTSGITHLDMVNEYYLDVSAVLNVSLCSLCENVDHEVKKAPKHTNKTRLKKGKHAFFEYRTLVIRPNQKHDRASSSNQRRKGVRQHLRRGHIRKLHTGKLTWVKHSVVGDVSRGVVSKNYKIEG